MEVLSLLLSIICPPLGIPLGLSGLHRDFNKWKIYIFCIAIGMSTFAFCYEPGDETDLVRYYEFLDIAGKLPYEGALFYGLYGVNNLVVFTTYAWLIAQTGIPQLLPASTVFLIYYICFYITCKCAEIQNFDKKYVCFFISLSLLLLPFYSLVNNIRNVLSLSLIGIACFWDFYIEKKSLVRRIIIYCCYVAPIFIHSSAMTILALRFLIPLIKRHKWTFFIGFLAVKEVLLASFDLIMGLNGDNVIMFQIKNVLLKAYFYFEDTDSEYALVVANSGSMFLQKVLNVGLAVIFSFLIIFLGAKNRVERLFSGRQYDYICAVFLLTVSAVAAASIITGMYWRFTAAMYVFGGPLVLNVLNCYDFKYKREFRTIISFMSLLIFVLWFRNLLNDNIMKIILEPFITSPLIWPIYNVIPHIF